MGFIYRDVMLGGAVRVREVLDDAGDGTNHARGGDEGVDLAEGELQRGQLGHQERAAIPPKRPIPNIHDTSVETKTPPKRGLCRCWAESGDALTYRDLEGRHRDRDRASIRSRRGGFPRGR